MSTVNDDDLFLAWDGSKSVAIKAGNIIDPPYANYLLLVNRGANSYQTTVDNACRNAQVGDTLLVQRNGASYALDGDEFIVNCCVEPPVVVSAGVIDDPVYRTMLVTDRFAIVQDGDNPSHPQYRWWYLKNGGTESNRNDWDVLTNWSDSNEHTAGDIGEQYEKIQAEVRGIDNTGIISRNTKFTSPSGLQTAVPPHVDSAGDILNYSNKGQTATVSNAQHTNGTFPATREYKFYLNVGGNTWTMYRDWSSSTSYATPPTADLYTEVKAEVRAIDSKGILSDNTMFTAAVPAANIQPPHVTSAGTIQLPTYKGENARINGASHTNGTYPASREYQWETLKNGNYTVRQSFSSSTTYRTPSQDNSFDGLRVTVRAKDNTTGMLSDNTMQTTSGAPPNAPPPINCPTVTIPSSFTFGSSVTISASTSDPAQKKYEFETKKGSSRDHYYGEQNSATFTINSTCPDSGQGTLVMRRDGMTKKCRSNTASITNGVIGQPSYSSTPTGPSSCAPNGTFTFNGGSGGPEIIEKRFKASSAITETYPGTGNVGQDGTYRHDNWKSSDGKTDPRTCGQSYKFDDIAINGRNGNLGGAFTQENAFKLLTLYIGGDCRNRCSRSSFVSFGSVNRG